MDYFTVKRLIDITISLLFLISFLPLVFLLSLLIWLEDKSNPFYSQVRIGQNRKPFKLFKFRSMVKNADDLLFNNPKLLEKMRSGAHKLTDDPRVTRVGRFIRKYSLDEFPQFINVLRGEMSFVGPRAYRPDELEKYEKEHPEVKENIKAILSVKPGITGFWQISGRSEIDFDKRIKMEAAYARRCSFPFDLYIIVRTPLAVLQAKGAV